MKVKNCINCGAPLHGTRCEYCGTEYSENGGIMAEFGDGEAYGTIKIGDQEIFHAICQRWNRNLLATGI